ncbi:PASTA domain-containing protein [Streptomyces sp. NPDC059605]|uniref:PASTA domain-containing protein n=1 Tax=unclassified Streptomyces TaxID=2593676 RepID=UPI0036A367EA
MPQEFMMSMPPGYGSPQQPLPYGHPPYPNPPAPVRRWWQHPAFVITALIVFPPGGIALAWLGRWSRTKKIIATVLAGLWFVTPFLGDPPKDEKDDAKARPAVTRTVTASPTTSTDPTPSPTPTPKPTMPAVVGKPYVTAEKAIEDLIVRELDAFSAYDDVDLPADHANWIVCFQSPDAGTTLVPEYADPDVSLVAPETRCPAEPHTDLHPEPTPTHADGDPDPDGSGGSSSDDSSSGGSSDSGGSDGVGTVTPGAYCSTPGSTGVSKQGAFYTCQGPGRERWRR